MNESYREAVAFATNRLRRDKTLPSASKYRTEPTEHVYMFAFDIELVEAHHEDCSTKYVISEGALAWLCMQAQHDRGAYEIARRIAANKILRNEPLTRPVRQFVGTHLAGLAKPPKPESQRQSQTFATNLYLVMLARVVSSRFGLNLTRNDTLEETGTSACDAVSEALKDVGVFKTPRAIKELLVHKSSRRVREIVDELAAISQSPAPLLDTAYLEQLLNDQDRARDG